MATLTAPKNAAWMPRQGLPSDLFHAAYLQGAQWVALNGGSRVRLNTITISCQKHYEQVRGAVGGLWSQVDLDAHSLTVADEDGGESYTFYWR